MIPIPNLAGVQTEGQLTYEAIRTLAKLSFGRDDVFHGSGPGHSTGLVPDPGPTPGPDRVLKENGSWDFVTALGIGAVALQGATPGVAQVGNANLSGTIIATTFTGALNGNATSSSDGLTSASGTAPLTLTLLAKALTGSVATMGGDLGAGGVRGVVPAQAIGDALKFLRGDATWQTVSTAAVTSLAAGSGITLTPDPIVATGTIALTAPVTPALGGSGTTTVFTTGSVIFAGASGVYTQDNAKFFWDDTGYFLGITTAAPTFPLSFGSSVGNKIGLYETGAGTGYGIGVQANVLQIFAPTTGDRVGLGAGNSGAFVEYLSVKNAMVGIGATSPGASLDVFGKFWVDSSGVITKINNVAYSSWPAANAAGVLTNSGAGALTWTAVSSTASAISYSQASALGMLATTGATTVQTALDDIDNIMYRSASPHGLEMTSYKTPVESTISYVAGTRTFTIAPKAPYTTFNVYYWGKRYTLTSQSVVHAATEGTWFFYFDSTGTLIASQTAWDVRLVCPVATIYWDNTNTTNIMFGEERHASTMDSSTHHYLHETVGTRYRLGLTLGNYTLSSNGAITASLTDGEIHDEDIEISITHAAAPGTNQFEQVLRTGNKALVPIYYRSGASGVWRKIAANASGYLADGPGANNRHFYNQFTGGAWQETQVGSGSMSAMWMFATNNISEPIILIMGQRTDGTLANARLNNTYESLSFGSMPFQEFKIIYRLIFSATGAAAWPSAIQLMDVQDLRSVSNLPSGTYVATSHAILTNLDYASAGHTGFVELQSTTPGTQQTTGNINVDGTIIAGLFSGPLTGNVTGNVTGSSGSCTGNAASSSTSAIVNDVTTNANMPLVWVTTNTGNLPLYVSSTELSFRPSTGVLTATGFSGPLTGNVTGNVSGSSGSCTGNAATSSDGLSSASGTAPLTLTLLAKALTGSVAVMQGDSGAGGAAGLVPAQAIGDATKVLSGAGTWIAAGGITGSGSAGRVTFWSGASALSSDATFLWDNATKQFNLGNGSGGAYDFNIIKTSAGATAGITCSATDAGGTSILEFGAAFLASYGSAVAGTFDGIARADLVVFGQGSGAGGNVLIRTVPLSTKDIIFATEGAEVARFTAAGAFDVASSKFVVDSSGLITKINNVAYTAWPASNVSGMLTNDGAGALTWSNPTGAGVSTLYACSDPNFSAGTSFERVNWGPNGQYGLIQLKPGRTFATTIADAKTTPPANWGAWVNPTNLTASDENTTTANGWYMNFNNATNYDWSGGTQTAPFSFKDYDAPFQEFIFRIASATLTAANKNTGFMLLETITTGKHIQVILGGSSGTVGSINVTDRATTYTAATTQVQNTAGIWCRLIRSGASVSCYYNVANQATPPATWTHLGGFPTAFPSGAYLKGGWFGVRAAAAGNIDMSVLYFDDSFFQSSMLSTNAALCTASCADGFPTSSPTIAFLGGFNLGDANATVNDADVRLALAEITNVRATDTSTITWSVTRGSSAPVAAGSYQAAAAVTVTGSGQYMSVYAKMLSTSSQPGSVDTARLAIPYTPAIAVLTSALTGSYTNGSVLFADTNLAVEDNSYFFYDKANHRLGIGTNAPGTCLHVASDTTAVGLATFQQASADADSFDIILKKSRGTVASPTVMTTADELGTIIWSGCTAAGTFVNSAAIKAISSGTVGATQMPSFMSFWTSTDAAPSVMTERMRIDNAGFVGIAKTVPIAVLHVYTGTARIVTECNFAGATSPFNLWNSDTGATTGAGIVIGAGGNGLTTGFIGGILSQRIDASSNSRTALRVLSNGTLSASDSTSLFYLEGTTGGGKTIIQTQYTGISTAAPTFPLSMGATVGDRIALYETGAGVGYALGVQSNVLQIYGPTSSQRVGIGYGSSASFTEMFSVKNTGVTVQGDANGSNLGILVATELLTVAAGASSTTAANLIPAGAIVIACTCRVTTTIPTATSFTLSANTDATVYTGAVSVGVNSTDLGTTHWTTISTTGHGTAKFVSTAAQKVKLTITGSNPANNNGRVRVTIYYWLPTAPTS